MKAPAILQKVQQPLTAAILIVFFSKVLVFCLGYIVSFSVNSSASPLSILMSQFYHWDSTYYLDIAKSGYINQGASQNLIVFFPLYPLIIRLVTTNFSYINLSALLVSNVSSFVAAFYLFKLVKLDYDDNAAVKAVLYFCIFPTAFFLSVMYTEGLFLALTIASFYYARMGKWRLAGLLSLFSALTRIGGLILLPALLIEYFHQKKWQFRKIDFNVLWISLSLAGFLIYISINYQITGNPFTFMIIENIKWYQSINPLLGLQ